MQNFQRPLGSGFGATSTAADVMTGINLSGKTAIVTGGHSGLGLETVRSLAGAGARVIVPARSPERARSLIGELRNVQVYEMDLMSPVSIARFASEFLGEHKALHILVNNAGIMALPKLMRNEQGHEAQFATNHLGHFELTVRLWPALAEAHGARVVAVSSRAHRLSPVVFEDVDYDRRPYDPWTAYGQSKTANALFAVELNRRGLKHAIRAFSVHPGAIYDTNLAQHMVIEDLQAAGALDEHGRPLIDPAQDRKTMAQGAATQLWCATSPQLVAQGGQYCENGDIAEMLPADVTPMVLGESESMTLCGVESFAVDPQSAQQLWNMSEELTVVTMSS